MRSARLKPVPPPDSAELQADFALINRELTDSCRQLERRVEALSSELEQVDRARLRELEQKEQLSERLRSLLDLLPAGVVVLDERGRIVDANPAARQMLGGSLPGERWGSVIRRAFRPRGDDGHEISLADGRRVSVETRSLERDSGQMVLITDQTATRDLQDRLSRHQRLTAMGRMMAALAHQIRTPLAAAMLYASNIHESELPREQVRRFSARLIERLGHMERQVRDMLTFVRGEAPPSETLDAADLLRQLREAIDPQLLAAGASCEASLDCPPGRTVDVNRDGVIGAVLNLVDNALQAGGAGTRIGLRVVAGAGRIGIEIRDDGPGMSEDVLRRVGQDFFSTRPGGTGLGIAVVRSVARAHGGELDIHSRPGEGTRACLWLAATHAGDSHDD